MKRLFTAAVCCQFALVLASCGGGGGGASGVVPQTVPQAADARLATESASNVRYVAVPLPANFIPQAMMSNGAIPGSTGRFAAVFRRNHVDVLGTFGDETAVAYYLNSRGAAVGYSTVPNSASIRALLFSASTVRDLGRYPGATDGMRNIVNEALVIGDQEQIYGFSDIPAELGGERLVQFNPDDDSAVALNPVGGVRAAGFIHNINSDGRYTVDQNDAGFPFGPFAAIGYGRTLSLMIGNHASSAAWINDRGDIAGYIDPVNEVENDAQAWNAFVHENGRTVMLPSFPGALAMKPTGINQKDQIDGTSITCAGFACTSTAFVYLRNTPYSIARLVPSLGAAQTVALPGISNQGAFVVQLQTATPRYFIVKPVEGEDE